MKIYVQLLFIKNKSIKNHIKTITKETQNQLTNKIQFNAQASDLTYDDLAAGVPSISKQTPMPHSERTALQLPPLELPCSSRNTQ